MKEKYIIGLFLVAITAFSCSKGDIDLASGVYNLSVITPDGAYHSGNAYLDQIGDVVTLQLFSSAGNFNFQGMLVSADPFDMTNTISSATSHLHTYGSDNSILDVEFSPTRDRFTGSITVGDYTYTTTSTSLSTTTTTTSGDVYLVRGDKM